MTTGSTFVSAVNSMIAAESSRITPMKMKHHAAMTPVRNKGPVMSISVRKRPAPKTRPASSSSWPTPVKADFSC